MAPHPRVRHPRQGRWLPLLAGWLGGLGEVPAAVSAGTDQALRRALLLRALCRHETVVRRARRKQRRTSQKRWPCLLHHRHGGRPLEQAHPDAHVGRARAGKVLRYCEALQPGGRTSGQLAGVLVD